MTRENRLRGSTTLRATTLAAPIERAVRGAPDVGRVLSVHRRAVNIAAPRAPGGIVAIIDRPDDVPFGIACRSPVGRTMTGLGIAPGMAVRSAPGCLTIAEAGVRIVVDRAAVERPTFGRVPIAPPRRVADAADLAGELVHAGATGNGAGLAFEPELRKRLATTTIALGDRDHEAAAVAGRSLVGLGMGLTPSGDDVLVGLVAVLAATGDSRARTLAAAWACDAGDRTTAVGAAYLAHAARTEFSGALRRAVAAILNGDADAVRASVAMLLARGATSGADALRGVLAGVDLALGGPAVGREAA